MALHDTQSEFDAQFDWSQQIETLRALVGVMDEAKLSELELEQDGVRLALKSPAARKVKVQAAPLPSAESPAPVEDFAETSEEAAATAEVADEVSGYEVVSPMVGIFYRAPSPSDPNFVEAGDHIEIGQTLGLVETMKVFNEITSEVEGTVTKILATPGALVETGDVLMTVQL